MASDTAYSVQTSLNKENYKRCLIFKWELPLIPFKPDWIRRIIRVIWLIHGEHPLFRSYLTEWELWEWFNFYMENTAYSVQTSLNKENYKSCLIFKWEIPLIPFKPDWIRRIIRFIWFIHCEHPIFRSASLNKENYKSYSIYTWQIPLIPFIPDWIRRIMRVL
jgi:hypothetical protein